MVGQAHTGEDHALLVAFFSDQIIANGAVGRSNILATGSKCTLDAIAKGKEVVTNKETSF